MAAAPSPRRHRPANFGSSKTSQGTIREVLAHLGLRLPGHTEDPPGQNSFPLVGPQHADSAELSAAPTPAEPPPLPVDEGEYVLHDTASEVLTLRDPHRAHSRR